MKAINFKYYAGAFIIIFAASCTKVIDLKLDNNAGQLVIEGNFTNSRSSEQIVTLSRNVAFTDSNAYPPVTGAAVSVHDNFGNNYPFIEHPAGIYTSDHAFGIPEATYTLSVTTGGINYTAQSKMPEQVRMDSISASNEIAPNNTESKKLITVNFYDPPNIANQYRFVMTVNSIQVKTIFVLNDAFTNGRYVRLDLREDGTAIHSGDFVEVEMQCIDQPIYTYWLTLLQEQGDNTGAVVTPSNPPTNITPAALGYFSAHTTQILRINIHQ